MKRRMQENRRTEVPTRHIAFDTETRPVPIADRPGACVHKLFIGHAVYWHWQRGRPTRADALTFRDARTFWDWAYGKAEPKAALWLWAHNLGFDLSAVRAWEEIEDGSLALYATGRETAAIDGAPAGGKKWQGALCAEDPPCYFRARTRAGALVVGCDTLNWCNAPLAEIGALLGIDKLPAPGELGTDDDWLAYCARDVDIVRAAVCKLLTMAKECDWGNWRYTAASQALQLYRHRCIDAPIVIDTSPDHKELERLCYHGARREVYFAGAVLEGSAGGLERFHGVPAGVPCLFRGPVYQLDMASAYPAVMADHLYPLSYKRTEYDVRPARLREYMRGLAACAEVVVDSGSEAWPCRRPDRTYWARGKFVTHLCGPELIRALDLQCVREVRRVNLYTMGDPFGRFVYAITGLRGRYEALGDQFATRVCKLLANSLHGKFAQRAHRWEMRPDVPSPQPWGTWHRRNRDTGQVETYRSIGWHVQQQTPRGEAEGSFPALSAYVLAYHRERMRQARIVAGDRDTLYEDADSLHVTHSGLLALQKRGWVDDKCIGRFRVVRAAKVALYRGVKHYQLDGELVCAGLSRKAVSDGKGLWQQTDFTGLEALLSHGCPPGPITVDVVKHAPEPCVPGRINPDGWVDPLLIRD